MLLPTTNWHNEMSSLRLSPQERTKDRMGRTRRQSDLLVDSLMIECRSLILRHSIMSYFCQLERIITFFLSAKQVSDDIDSYRALY